MSSLRARGALGALILSAALVAAGCAAPATSKAPPPWLGTGAAPLEVGVDEAAMLQDGGALLLDVREPDEWVAGHIPGSVHIPLGQLAARVSEVPADRVVVVVCRSGNRSAQGRDILRDAGLDRVTSMAGGVIDWSAAGLPLVTGQ